jgi:hypothetical protein
MLFRKTPLRFDVNVYTLNPSRDAAQQQDEHHHAPLLALMILSLGDEYLQRNGIGERRDN